MERPRGRNLHLAWRSRPPTSTVSLFVSNLPPAISKAELEAMFVMADKVIDSFIPTDRSSEKQKGFGFVRFKSEKEAFLGLELASGRSWGGRRILVDLARPRTENSSSTATVQHPPSSVGILGRPPPSFPRTLAPPSGNVHLVSNPWSLPPSGLSGSTAGWIVRDGSNNFIQVAPWAVEMEKNTICLSLIASSKIKV
ncbi:hypothetical protein AAC387_Pa10g0840 [Persea americana]